MKLIRPKSHHELRADTLTWVVDNIYTIARREHRRAEDGKPLRPEMWGHVLRLCEQAGAHARTVGVLRTDDAVDPVSRVATDRPRAQERSHSSAASAIRQQEGEQAATVTRFEVIDASGRVYTKWGCSIELSYQDDGRTLKVFVKPPAAPTPPEEPT